MEQIEHFINNNNLHDTEDMDSLIELAGLVRTLINDNQQAEINRVLQYTMENGSPPGSRASHVVLVVKNPLANAGDTRDAGLIPEWRRSPGGGKGNPLQYACQENPTDREAWKTTVLGFAKQSDTT